MILEKSSISQHSHQTRPPCFPTPALYIALLLTIAFTPRVGEVRRAGALDRTGYHVRLLYDLTAVVVLAIARPARGGDDDAAKRLGWAVVRGKVTPTINTGRWQGFVVIQVIVIAPHTWRVRAMREFGGQRRVILPVCKVGEYGAKNGADKDVLPVVCDG
jgi:hypothetical protein